MWPCSGMVSGIVDGDLVDGAAAHLAAGADEHLQQYGGRNARVAGSRPAAAGRQPPGEHHTAAACRGPRGPPVGSEVPDGRSSASGAARRRSRVSSPVSLVLERVRGQVGAAAHDRPAEQGGPVDGHPARRAAPRAR